MISIQIQDYDYNYIAIYLVYSGPSMNAVYNNLDFILTVPLKATKLENYCTDLIHSFFQALYRFLTKLEKKKASKVQ